MTSRAARLAALGYALASLAPANAADPRWGTIDSPVGTARGAAQPAPLPPFAAAARYTKAQYSTGGTGLRNLGSGALHVSGVTPPVKAAFLYWAVITLGAPPAADKTVALTQLFPKAGKTATLTGTAIGSGAAPCWLKKATITVFKATVPAASVSGNGTYQVAFTGSGASGSTAGEDPWRAAVPPLLEGASLVVVGTGTATVYLFDKSLAGQTFGTRTNPESLTYALTLAAATRGGQVLFDSIGADGQIGASRTAGYSANSQPYLANEATVINGQVVAGPYNVTYIDYDSDWNGNAAAPLPRLWDDVGHDITAAAPAGTSTLTVQLTTFGDCLTPVANVVAVY